MSGDPEATYFDLLRRIRLAGGGPFGIIIDFMVVYEYE